MLSLKSDKEIKIMQEAGAMLHEVLEKAPEYILPGTPTSVINDKIEKHIVSLGGEPGFKRVKGYSWGTCICVNEQIVHTPPSDRKIEPGDVVTVDAGVFYNGLHTDSAITIQVEPKTQKVTQFLDVGKSALKKALEQTKVGNRIGHISKVFQNTIEGAGYSIVRELTGHGVGKELHEDPYIPCFVHKKLEKTLELQEGMTLAIEVMYAMGERNIVTEADGWSIKMADNSVAATFEHTVALKKGETLILT